MVLLESSLIDKQANARNRSLRERKMSMQTANDEKTRDKHKNGALFLGKKIVKIFFLKE